MAEINEVNARVLRAMDGGDKIRYLLADNGLALKDFSRKYNVWVQEVSMCLRGERPYPEIRDALAKETGVSRTTIDHLIDDSASGKSDPADAGRSKDAA